MAPVLSKSAAEDETAVADLSTPSRAIRFLYNHAIEAHFACNHEKANEIADFILLQPETPIVCEAGAHYIRAHAPQYPETQLEHMENALKLLEQLDATTPKDHVDREYLDHQLPFIQGEVLRFQKMLDEAVEYDRLNPITQEELDAMDAEAMEESSEYHQPVDLGALTDDDEDAVDEEQAIIPDLIMTTDAGPIERIDSDELPNAHGADETQREGFPTLVKASEPQKDQEEVSMQHRNLLPLHLRTLQTSPSPVGVRAQQDSQQSLALDVQLEYSSEMNVDSSESSTHIE